MESDDSSEKSTGASTPILAIDLPATLAEQLATWQEFKVLDCPPEYLEVLACCRRSAPNVFLVGEKFVLSADPFFVTELGRLIPIIAVYSSQATPMSKLLQIGCSGAVSRFLSPGEIRRAIHSVAGGELWFPRKIIASVIRTLLASTPQKRLTPRESEILRLIGQGYNNRQIADALFISRETVRWHVRSLNAKIGTHDRKYIPVGSESEPEEESCAS